MIQLQKSDVIDLNIHYGEDESSTKYVPVYNTSILDDRLSLYIQEIELAVRIGPKQLWGVKTCLHTEKYIFNQYITLNQIKNEMLTFITNECYHSQYFNTNIAAGIYRINNKDMIYVLLEILPNPDTEPIQLTYILGYN